MGKNIRDSRLRETEEGINGLTIISRKLLPRTKGSIKPEKYIGPGNSDLRKYPNIGALIPLEDYRILGIGRKPIVIREVETDAREMRKYALIDFEQDSEQADVRYVYSEGIEIEKMVEDAKYAKSIIALLQEERLQEKEEASYKLQTNTVYIGTVGKTERGYGIIEATDYATTISKIEASIEEGKQNSNRKYRELTRPEEEAERKEKINMELEACDNDQLAYIVASILSKESSRNLEFLEKIKQYKKEIEGQSLNAKLYKNDANEEPEQ